MKPAPFRYHAPKTVDEAVKTLAEVAPDDGRVLAGGQSLVPIMAFRLSRPSHLVDINGVEALKRLAVEGDKLVDRRRRAPCRVSAPGGRRAARQAARHGGAAHRALSDPHPRHVLRQRRARRPGVRMVPGGGDARRRDGGEERARRAPHPGAGLLPGHHDDGARRGRTADRGAAADPAARHPLRLLRVQPPRRRLRARHGAGHLPRRQRRDRRSARRRRRRRAAAAPDGGGREAAGRQAAGPRGLRGGRRRPRPPRSIRWRMRPPAPSIGATWSAPSTRRALEQAAA